VKSFLKSDLKWTIIGNKLDKQPPFHKHIKHLKRMYIKQMMKNLISLPVIIVSIRHLYL